MNFCTQPLLKFEDRPLLFLDTEYSSTPESCLVKPICVVAMNDNITFVDSFLLGFDTTTLQRLIDTHTIVCHAAMAELGFLHSLNINLDRCQVIDTLAEFRLLTNNSKKWGYGKVISSGKKTFSVPPVDQEDKKKLKKLTTPEGERRGKSKSDASLLAFVYKMTVELTSQPVLIDAKHKEAMRELCIRYNIPALIENIDQVLEYCAEDVRYLKLAYTLLTTIPEYKVMAKEFRDIERGSFSISMHKATVFGIPVNLPGLFAIAKKSEELMLEAKKHLNEVTGMRFYRGEEEIKWKSVGVATSTSLKRVGTKDISVLHKYLLMKYPEIPMTDSGKPSTSSDDLEIYKHDSVVYNYLQTQKTLSALRSLTNKKSDGTEKEQYLFDYIGSDSKLRLSNWGMWGTQTGRNAPKASIFILAMAKWLRAFMAPPPGYAIVEVDYSSQESLLAGIVYNDNTLIQAYSSGDVYMAFGKQSGILPEHATKKTHADMRQKLKAIVLGSQYGMGATTLALHYASETWKAPENISDFNSEWTAHKERASEESYELLQQYKDTYHDLFEARDEAWEKFEEDGYIDISRNWRLYDALPFYNSILNAPVQGLGAEIMRRFMYLLTTNAPHGVQCFAPLHDASYSLVPIQDLVPGTEWICEQMLKAVTDVCPHPSAKLMRVGIDIISPELEEGEISTKYGPAKVQHIFFADDNAKHTYEKYKKIFSKNS